MRKPLPAVKLKTGEIVNSETLPSLEGYATCLSMAQARRMQRAIREKIHNKQTGISKPRYLGEKA